MPPSRHQRCPIESSCFASALESRNRAAIRRASSDTDTASAASRRIGSGGFATVWLAYDEQLDSPVAIKVLADNWTEDHQIRQRFLEEGRYLRKVESPHVVSVYDAGELDDGRPYLVMS